MRKTAGFVVVSVLALLATGCVSSSTSGTGSTNMWACDSDDLGNCEAPVVDGPDDYAPEEHEPQYQWDQSAPEPVAAWSCYLSITFNEDWHDDVECSNGIDVDWPYLREWDDFVTEEELMQSAFEYENALNAG